MGGYSAPAGTGGAAAAAAGRKRNRSESANPQFQGGAAPAIEDGDDAGGWVDEDAENDDEAMVNNGNAWLPGGGGIAGATQQQVLDKLMEDAQRNGRKASKALENEKDKIIRDVETNVDTMIDEVEKDINERIQQIDRFVNSTQALSKKAARHNLERLEDQFSQLTILLKEYEKTVDAQNGPKLQPGYHTEKRQNHARKLDKNAAREAIRLARDAKREEQMATDIKKFNQAHKQLFRTLGSSSVVSTEGPGQR